MLYCARGLSDVEWERICLMNNDDTPQSRPNVVLILTDDQGYGDLSCHGNPILRTPELDRLHDESIRFTDFHVSPTCAPTRASLMSGHFSNRTGVWHTILGRSLMREGETTLGEVFHKSGYATGLFGKWHLGDNFPYRAEDRGFEEVVRHGGGGVGQTPDYWDNAYFDGHYFHNGEPQPYHGYCTDVFFAEAMKFMGRATEENRPFFALVSTNAPHGPLHCPEAYWKPYLDAGLSHEEAVFFGMIANVDENIGRLRAFLEERGLAHGTILIFMTDNGTATGHSIYNAGMRGAKGSPYEGGHRVPFFLSWPARGLDGGRDLDLQSAHVDLLPTLIGLCQLEPPPAPYRFDGISLAPWLGEEPGPKPPDRTLVTDSQRVLKPEKWRESCVMQGPWRLINGSELYNLLDDPGQEKDLAADAPQVVTRLREAYEAWWADLEEAMRFDAAIPLGGPDCQRAVLTAHDWQSEQTPPWHQGDIRQGLLARGRWSVEILSAGNYRIELRRWPEESGGQLRGGIAAGKPVPGCRAYREAEGRALAIASAELRWGGQRWTKAVHHGSPAACFEARLEPGKDFLEGVFHTEDGEELGSYYAIAEKLG